MLDDVASSGLVQFWVTCVRSNCSGAPTRGWKNAGLWPLVLQLGSVLLNCLNCLCGSPNDAPICRTVPSRHRGAQVFRMGWTPNMKTDMHGGETRCNRVFEASFLALMGQISPLFGLWRQQGLLFDLYDSRRFFILALVEVQKSGSEKS